MRSVWMLFLISLLGCRTDPLPNKPPPSVGTSAPPPETALAEVKYIEVVKGDATKALPMVVAIHGLGDRPEHFAALFDSYDSPARFIMVQGIKPFSGGFSWFDLGTPIDSDEKAAGVDYAARSIAALLESLPKKYQTAGKPVVTGFSQGGMLSFAIAAQRPDLIQAAIPLAGFLPRKLLPTEKPANIAPIYALHGDADRRIEISLGQESVEKLSALGFSATLEPFVGVGHSLPAPVRASLFTKLKALTLPPVKSCELESDCSAEISARCASNKGSVQCIRPYTTSGEHLLGNCSVTCQ
jgi:phospholipase/carboxylesterase